MRKVHKLIYASFGSILGILASHGAFAEAAQVKTATTPTATGSTTTTAVTNPPNSGNNYLDDRFVWPYAVQGRTNLGQENNLCIPPGTKLIGAKSSMDSATTTTLDTSGGNLKTSAEASQWQEVYLDTHKTYFDLFGDPVNVTGSPPNRQVTSVAVCNLNSPQDLREGQLVYVSSDDVGKALRTGWDYGVLVAPFKLQLSKDKEFSGSATVGPYAGYRFPLSDFGLTFNLVGFAGASTISVNTTNSSGQTSSQTLAGLSYGGGIITSIKESNFQVGLLLGFDHVNSSSNYKYNNKPWLSFEIGYSFMQ